MSLLDPYRFGHESQINPDALDDLMIRRLKDDMYDTDGTRMFPEKNIEALGVDMSRAERKLYDDVTEYIREYYNLAPGGEPGRRVHDGHLPEAAGLQHLRDSENLWRTECGPSRTTLLPKISPTTSSSHSPV